MTKEKNNLKEYDNTLKYQKEFRQAIIQFRKKMKSVVIPKDKVMSYNNRHHKYADIDGIQNAIVPVLAECDLNLKFKIQPLPEKEDREVLYAIVEHVNGCFEFNRKNLPISKTPQDYGSNLTYFKRYLVCALLAISAEDCPDGVENEAYKKLKGFVFEKRPGMTLNEIDELAGSLCKKNNFDPTTIKNYEVDKIIAKWENWAKEDEEKKSPQVK